MNCFTPTIYASPYFVRIPALNQIGATGLIGATGPAGGSSAGVGSIITYQVSGVSGIMTDEEGDPIDGSIISVASSVNVSFPSPALPNLLNPPLPDSYSCMFISPIVCSIQSINGWIAFVNAGTPNDLTNFVIGIYTSSTISPVEPTSFILRQIIAANPIVPANGSATYFYGAGGGTTLLVGQALLFVLAASTTNATGPYSGSSLNVTLNFSIS